MVKEKEESVSEFKCFRGFDIVVDDKDDGGYSALGRPTPDSIHQQIVAFLNKWGAEGWQYQNKHSDFFENDESASLVMFRDKSVGYDHFEFKMEPYSLLKPEGEGHLIFSQDTIVEKYLEALKKEFDEGGWRIVDFNRVNGIGFFAIFTRKVLRKAPVGVTKASA